MTFKNVENIYSKEKRVFARKFCYKLFGWFVNAFLKCIIVLGYHFCVFANKTIGITRTIYVQRMVEPDHHAPPANMVDQAPIVLLGVYN